MKEYLDMPVQGRLKLGTCSVRPSIYLFLPRGASKGGGIVEVISRINQNAKIRLRNNWCENQCDRWEGKMQSVARGLGSIILIERKRKTVMSVSIRTQIWRDLDDGH